MEAMMKIHQHRSGRQRQGHCRGAQALVHADVQAPGLPHDYLPTFNRPNVHLIDTHGKGINEITEKGPVFEGKQYEVDVLIYATGFEVQRTGTYNQIKGANGLDINNKHREG